MSEKSAKKLRTLFAVSKPTQYGSVSYVCSTMSVSASSDQLRRRHRQKVTASMQKLARAYCAGVKGVPGVEEFLLHRLEMASFSTSKPFHRCGFTAALL